MYVNVFIEIKSNIIYWVIENIRKLTVLKINYLYIFCKINHFLKF